VFPSGAQPESPPAPLDDEPSAAERDALLNADDANAPPGETGAPPLEIAPTAPSTIDSAAAFRTLDRSNPEGQAPVLRDRRVDPDG
jgi:hypothetical protein